MINRLTEYLPAERTGTKQSSARHFSLSSQNVRQWIEPVEQIIVKYPTACLASAFVIGATIAWWIKRK
jgi:hypothetical protein